MNDREWLIRAGALAVLLGFFLPSMTVSCSGMPGMGQTFSLADLADKAEQPLLYLVPIGILVLLGISIFVNQSQAAPQTIWGKGIGAGLGLVSLLISYASVLSDMGDMGEVMFDISPEFGMAFILGGYLAIGVGVAMQVSEMRNQVLAPLVTPPGPQFDYPPPSPPTYQSAYSGPVQPAPPPTPATTPLASLEILSGNVAQRLISIKSTEFSIGRGPMNDFQVPDAAVSRAHTRLRFAQGVWFVQDQGSTGGTFVNGRLVQATRLQSGDQLMIGNTTLLFTVE